MDVRDDAVEGNNGASRVAFTHRAACGIVHDEEGHRIYGVEVEDAYDMGMTQASDGTGLCAESVNIGRTQLCIEHFNGGLGTQVNMLSKVDFGGSTCAEPTEKTIAPKALSYKVGVLLYHAHHP